MAQLVAWLSILGAAVAFIVDTILKVFQRRTEANERQFQAFHKIVENVVAPDPKAGQYYEDKQAAVIFELRHFPRYYAFTERMLKRLKKKWQTEPGPFTATFIEEIDLTLEHIRSCK